jgi:hypothetical protein
MSETTSNAGGDNLSLGNPTGEEAAGTSRGKKIQKLMKKTDRRTD